MFRNLVWISVLAALVACNPTRVVKPLEKGEKRVSAAFGGPGIIFSGAPIPLPLTSVNYSHGLDSGLTLSTGLHTTALMFSNLQTDISLGIKMVEAKSKRYGLTANPGLNLMYSLRGGEFRAYPQVEGIGWWQYGEKSHLFYGGVGTWVELMREKAHGEVQDHELMPYVTLGHQFAGEKWIWQVEAKYLGFTYSNDNVVVDYMGPFNTGTTGVYVGLSRRLTK